MHSYGGQEAFGSGRENLEDLLDDAKRNKHLPIASREELPRGSRLAGNNFTGLLSRVLG